ncbi:hypothetical protein ACHHV8_29755 [Paenibacillus sp. TAB 01]|uniref:hypothetical protein n=1 Tax=Paenibacillus sp. TAB 01 TaxID=3368988 RepID=UPI003750AEE6
MAASRAQNYKTCKKYLHRQVQIRTVNGTYQGKIVKLDKDKVYLQLNAPHGKKSQHKAHISFFPVVLPLVLFELLVIVLLEGRRPLRPF